VKNCYWPLLPLSTSPTEYESLANRNSDNSCVKNCYWSLLYSSIQQTEPNREIASIVAVDEIIRSQSVKQGKFFVLFFVILSLVLKSQVFKFVDKVPYEITNGKKVSNISLFLIGSHRKSWWYFTPSNLQTWDYRTHNRISNLVFLELRYEKMCSMLIYGRDMK
jgi:hypothetical protein